jgi:heterodisulfide reductase subunit C
MKVKPDPDFVEQVKEITGENPNECYQCGTCTAGCPFADKMDIPLERLFRLVILGEKRRVLLSIDPWVCAACFTCSVRCPRGLDVAKIMEGLRQIKLRENVDETDIEKVENIEEIPQAALVGNFRKHTG